MNRRLLPTILRLGLLLLPSAALGCQPKPVAQGSHEPRIIRMEVQVQDGPMVKGLVEEGEFLRFNNQAAGLSLSFKPILTPPVKVQVFEIQRGGGGAEAPRFLDQVEVAIGPDTVPQTVAGKYLVRIIEVMEGSPTGEKVGRSQDGARP